MNHKVIGISQSFSPAPFVRALKERLQSTFLPSDGSRPRIELVDLDSAPPDADAPKLVQEGDVKIRVLEESYQLIEKGAQVIALCNFRNISFLNEVQTEITTPVTDILQACIEELKKNPVKKLGYLGRPGTDKSQTHYRNRQPRSPCGMGLSERSYARSVRRTRKRLSAVQ